jgi:hypothetical protein
MHTTSSRLSVLVMVLIAGLILTACPGPKPTPTPIPATAIPTVIPATPTPDGWVEHQSSELNIWLPKDWDVLELGDGDLQTVFAEFQKTNPELAKIIGSADALQGVALWGFKTGDSEAAFVDNLNIRRSPLGAQKIDKMQDVVNAVLDQYRQLGFEVGTTRADLQIDGYPAAHIAYSFTVTSTAGQPAKVNGHQYLVATPTDLWILSYTAAPGADATLAPVFEQSAMSFKVK